MSSSPEQNQTEQVKTDTTQENLVKQRKYYERQLEQEKLAREQAEQKAADLEKRTQQLNRPIEDDDDDAEPYVDKRKLKKELNRFGEQAKQQTTQEIQQAVQQALDQERTKNYLKENSDFNQIMGSDIVQKFADAHPRLAENILRMPEGFERQKLVYENIKALGLDKPQQKQPSIQDKIDANRRSPFYQPSGSGTAPYAQGGDFSPQGQKNAHAKMQELKGRLRLG